MRRTLAALALVLAPAGIASAEDPPPEARITLSIVPPVDDVYVGQVFGLGFTVHYDASWLDEHAVPPFLQSIDVPMELEVPWLRTLPGTVQLPGQRFEKVPAMTFALNGEVAVGMGRPDGQRGTLLHLTRHRADAAGALVLSGTTVRFAWSPSFESDALGARVPAAIRRVEVVAPEIRLQVLPLPEEGRPPEFSGAVGRFRLSAQTDRVPRDVDRPFPLVLTIRNVVSRAEVVPRLDRLPGFHVYGSLVDDQPLQRVITYSVAVTDPSVREIPPIELSYFDSESKRYEVARTEPIPLEVRPAPHAPDAPPAPPKSTKPARPDVPEPPPWRWGVMAVVTILFAVLLPPLIRRSLRRRRGEGAHDPGRARLDAALSALRSASPSDSAAFADALSEVLAAHLNAPRAAAISPDLASRLVHSGMDPALASRAAAALDSLVSSRYGGPAPDPSSLAALARDL